MSNRSTFLQLKTSWFATLKVAMIKLTLLLLALSACSRSNPGPAISPDPAVSQNAAHSPAPTLEPGSTATVELPASATPFQPSPTPEPLAARVNGEEIALTDYQAELARFQAAAGQEPSAEDARRVLDDLIGQTLLAQAAAQTGFVVDEAMLQERISQLTNQVGGAQALDAWMAAHGFVEESFRKELSRSIAAAWMRDRILDLVPGSAEQIHARQILVYEPDQANQVYAQLQAGENFARLADQFDPITGGDLGWFPRGYLTDRKLEEAAFNTEPGKYTSVIETLAGFHILQVIERDPQRILEPDALQALKTQALKTWMDTQRSQSDIQILLP